MLDDFSRVLRFKPHLLVLDAGPDTLFIVDEFRRAVLRGAVYVRIAACLRDRLTIAATMAALSAGDSRSRGQMSSVARPPPSLSAETRFM